MPYVLVINAQSEDIDGNLLYQGLKDCIKMQQSKIRRNYTLMFFKVFYSVPHMPNRFTD